MSAIPTPEDARQTLRELTSLMDAFSRWKGITNERLEALEDENEELRNAVHALEERLDVVEGGASTKEGKVRNIVEYAENARGRNQRFVIVNAKELKGAAGVSRRYAYDLIDDLPREYAWIRTQREVKESQYGNAEMDWDKSKKALAVDFERLHRDPESVNKFTTPREGEGV